MKLINIVRLASNNFVTASCVLRDKLQIFSLSGQHSMHLKLLEKQ